MSAVQWVLTLFCLALAGALVFIEYQAVRHPPSARMENFPGLGELIKASPRLGAVLLLMILAGTFAGVVNWTVYAGGG